MYFCGQYGNGKTSLMALVAMGLSTIYKVSGYWIYAVDMFNTSNNFQDPQKRDILITNMKNVNLLFIDDLGKEKPTPNSLAYFSSLIEHRYSNQKPTFITSNHTIETLAHKEGYEQLADRLNDSKWITQFHLQGKSQRKQ